ERRGKDHALQLRQVESGGGGILMLETVLGLLQVPEVGALVRGQAARLPMLDAFLLGFERRLPKTDRFVPVRSRQATAVWTEDHARIESRVPVALRCAAQRQDFLASFGDPHLDRVPADARQAPAIRAEHQIAKQAWRRQGQERPPAWFRLRDLELPFPQ